MLRVSESVAALCWHFNEVLCVYERESWILSKNNDGISIEKLQRAQAEAYLFFDWLCEWHHTHGGQK